MCPHGVCQGAGERGLLQSMRMCLMSLSAPRKTQNHSKELSPVSMNGEEFIQQEVSNG